VHNATTDPAPLHPETETIPASSTIAAPDRLTDDDHEALAAVNLALAEAADALAAANRRKFCADVAFEQVCAVLRERYALGEHDRIKDNGRILRSR
jgi:hypothetical protein